MEPRVCSRREAALTPCHGLRFQIRNACMPLLCLHVLVRATDNTWYDYTGSFNEADLRECVDAFVRLDLKSYG